MTSAPHALQWRRRALALALLLAALIAATASARLHGWLIAVLPAAEDLLRAHPVAGAAAFVVYAAFSAMLAFVSGAVIVPVGVYVWGKVASLTLLLLGWVLGGIGTYLLGRYFGEAVVRALGFEPVLRRLEHHVTGRAPFALVVLLQLALPSEIPGYLLGLLRYDPLKFVGVLTLGSLPYAVAAVYLAEGFVDRNVRLIAGAGLAVIALSAGTLAALHRGGGSLAAGVPPRREP